MPSQWDVGMPNAECRIEESDGVPTKRRPPLMLSPSKYERSHRTEKPLMPHLPLFPLHAKYLIEIDVD